VKGQYVLRGDNRIAFELGDYDRRRPVVIDPALAYSTYLGGSDGDQGYGIAADASGNAYIAGLTLSADFPTTLGAFQTTFAGGYYDAFVSKLNATGSALVYSTYLGGNNQDEGLGIAIDASGNAYVTGVTDSSNFPITSGAFQTSNGGQYDTFITKLNESGSALLYSTYLGGSNDDWVAGIAIDGSGNAYVTGWTSSPDFPTTPGAFQTSPPGAQNAFVTKLNAVGSAPVYSTYLGGVGPSGGGSGIAVDASGNAYVIGHAETSDFPTTPGAFQTTYGGERDAFVSKLDAVGSALIYSTYLGGSNLDFGSGIAVDASGSAYVTGATYSSNFPTTPGAFQTTHRGHEDAFVSKLNAAGSALLYSTYLGGGGGASGIGIAVDTSGNAYLTGAAGAGFPTTPGAFQTTFGGGTSCSGSPCSDAFVGKLNATGSALLYSTYLGGSGSDYGNAIAIDASHNAYVTGNAGCTISGDMCAGANFPTTPGAFQTTFGGGNSDAFVAKMTFPNGPVVALKPSTLPFLVLLTVGTTSLPNTVKLTNVGSGQLNINAIIVTGPELGDFAQSNNCLPSVASGASCLITVTFTPTAQGVRTASVSITDNAIGSPQTVPLSGRATFFQWSPRYMNMGDQKVGTSSAARTVTLSNVGSAPIALFSIQIGGVNAGDFSQTNSCGSSLKAGASCTIQVTFTPTAVGSRLGHVAIRDSAFGGTHWVGLLGKGT